MIVRTHAVTRYFVAGSDEDDDSVSMPKCLQFSFFIHHFKPKSRRRKKQTKYANVQNVRCQQYSMGLVWTIS